jgi:acetyl esterase/lipase
MLVHGGGWGSGDKYKDMLPVFEPLTKGGFLWVSVNYRLAPRDRWPACLDDVKAAVRWVKSHAAEYRGDPKRVAILGHSAGGQLAFMTAATGGEAEGVQAVVGIAPVTDALQDLEARGGFSKAMQDLLDHPKEVGGEPGLALLRSVSPINFVHAGMAPVLILHGTGDKTVPLAQSTAMRDKLEKLKVPCELVTIEGAPHNFAQWPQRPVDYREALVGWLKKTLGAK